MKNELSISIVIPVYNEQNHLKTCLDAIAAQTVKPLEVIVVDNNSTDQSVNIARAYSFVKVVHESHQGRGAARTLGFNTAQGDIIGRVDADCAMMPSWVERVQKNFSDASVSGITGLAKANTLPIFTGLYTTLWSRIYFWTVHSYFDAITMWGANMAIRRTAWQKARQTIILDDSIVHEDQDVSLVMLGLGQCIKQDNKLLVKMSGQGVLYWPKFWEYFTRAVSTKQHHKNTFPPDSKLRIGFWQSLPGAVAGWAFTTVFIACSFITWPINALKSHK